ncbi:MAG: hypothetical protein CMP39_00330 [Rickettsiales bacterium]|nr:hypothetical protein [Rickettsiales bacterium]
MMIRKHMVIICSLLFLLVLSSHAETNKVIVTATRENNTLSETALSISSISETQLKSGKPMLSLGETLNQVPGIFSQNQYNYAQDLRVSIRGFGARSAWGIRGIKIIVDGIPFTYIDGQSQIDQLAVEDISKIEIIRGPMSALYGNAAGGTIMITTKDKEKNKLEINSIIGPWGLSKITQKAAGNLDSITYLLNMSYLSQEGWREHSEIKQTSFNGKMKMRLKDHSTLLIMLNGIDSPFAYDPGGLTREDAETQPRRAWTSNISYDTGEQVKEQRLSALYTRQFSRFDIESSLYTLGRQFENAIPARVVKFDRIVRGGYLNMILPLSFKKVNHFIVSGVEIAAQEDARENYNNSNGQAGNTLLLNQNEKLQSIGLYSQDQISFNKMNIILGSRYDRLGYRITDYDNTDGDQSGKTNFDQLTNRFGVSYKFKKSIIPYTAVSQSFETPSLTEIVNRADGNDGINTALKPQYATNYEIGVKGNNKRLRYDLALFKVNLKNELIKQTEGTDNGAELDYYVNSGHSERIGLEYSSQFNATKHFFLNVTASYIKATFTHFSHEGELFSGNYIPGIPKLTIGVELIAEHNTGLFLSLDYNQANNIYLDNANDHNVNEMNISNLRLGYKINQKKINGTCFVGIRNLTNETYFDNLRINAFGNRFYEVSPARNLYAGLNITRTF